MKRQDLMVLSVEDLALLSNKGNVKRALRELERDDITLDQYDETQDKQLFVWNDATCTLLTGQALDDTQCTCPSTKICRHLVRSVLSYQARHADASSEHVEDVQTTPATDTKEALIWRPAQITDEQLEQNFTKALLREAKQHLNAGVVAEVQAARRPTVTFHRLGCTVKFVVPHNPNYATCSCHQKKTCVHIPLAVFVDRQANAAKDHSFVSTVEALTLPPKAYAQVDRHLHQLIEQGVMGLSPIAKQRLERTVHQLKEAKLIWPASILDDMLEQYEAYQQHDAQFMPQNLPALVGQWLIRRDAMHYDGEPPTPKWFVHGEDREKKTKLAQTHLIGLGCALEYQAESSKVVAYFYNQTTHDITTIVHEHASEGIIPVEQVMRADRPLAQLATQHLIVQRAALDKNDSLNIDRAQVGVYPQHFKWEELGYPVFQESIKQAKARLQNQPPTSLRTRHATQNIAVLALSHVRDAHFNERRQCIEATIVDQFDQTAQLSFAYHNNNRHGTERLLHLLKTQAESIRYIAGHIQLDAAGLLIRPISLVSHIDGETTLFQPWINNKPLEDQNAQTLKAKKNVPEPLAALQQQLGHALGQLYLLGLEHLDGQTHKTWSVLWQNIQNLGLAPVLGSTQHVCQLVDPDNANPTEAQIKAVLQTTMGFELLREMQ